MKRTVYGTDSTQDPHRTGDDTGSIGGGYLYRRLFVTRRKWKPDSVQTDLSVIDGASGGVWLFYAYWQEEEEKEQTCRELLHALQTWQKEHVDEKLLKLQKMKGAQDIRERQFYGMAHAIWLYMNEAIPQEDYLGCCRTIWESDAQGKTRRRQGMDKIEFAEMSEVQALDP